MVKILRKTHGYSGKIVAVTASVMKRDTDQVKTSGCDGFIPKPLDDDFCELVAEFL